MTNVWFTADTHFGHKAIISYMGRPFVSAWAMDEFLIKNWNDRVQVGDHVYHLGDVSFHGKKHTEEILYALKGKIFLVNGNHDKGCVMKSKRFEWIKPYHEWHRNKESAVLCHYPFATWNKAHWGRWNLHGHSHGAFKGTNGKQMDVGVDIDRRYKPFHLDEVREIIMQRVYKPVDHHGVKEDG